MNILGFASLRSCSPRLSDAVCISEEEGLLKRRGIDDECFLNSRMIIEAESVHTMGPTK